MAYKFGDKTTHKQEENAYIVYMIMGSYFKKCECKSEAMETSLRLFYRDMQPAKQEKREEDVIRELDRITKDYQDELANVNCEAHIRKAGDNYKIIFSTGLENIEAVVDKAGKYTVSYTEN